MPEKGPEQPTDYKNRLQAFMQEGKELHEATNILMQELDKSDKMGPQAKEKERTNLLQAAADLAK